MFSLDLRRKVSPLGIAQIYYWRSHYNYIILGATAYRMLCNSTAVNRYYDAYFNCGGSERRLVDCLPTTSYTHNNDAGIKCCECDNERVLPWQKLLALVVV